MAANHFLIQQPGDCCTRWPHCQCVYGISDLRDSWDNHGSNIVMGGQQLNRLQNAYIRENLIRTISLLNYMGVPNLGPRILEWIRDNRKWDEKLLAQRLSQRDIAHLVQDDARQGLFGDASGRFTAPIIHEGRDIELQNGQRMPFQGDSENVGEGMNGPVESYPVARGHLNLTGRVSVPSRSVETRR